jgi:hypothetical protein
MPPTLAKVLSALSFGLVSASPAAPEPPPVPEASGVITEDIRAALNEAAEEIAAKEKELEVTKAALAEVGKERDAFKAKAEEKEQTIRARVLNEEVAAVAASQGVPPADLPGQPKADAGEDVDALRAQLANATPEQKAEISRKLREVRWKG